MGDDEQGQSLTAAVSRTMVRLHKEQFGRGALRAKTSFVGNDVMVCQLEDVMVPAELKLVELGKADIVQTARVEFQIATRNEFIAAVEQLLQRKVRAFTSALDPSANVLFEVFAFEKADN